MSEISVYKRFDPAVKKILKNGGVGVIPTDTIYGVAGSAFSPKAVNRIYRLRKRSPQKPFIILISSISDLKKFGATYDTHTLRFLRKYWPGKVSVVLPCPHKNVLYLHRGTQAIAFRVPASPTLRKLLSFTGPLVAPSANLEGKPPAEDLAQAEKYFKKKVDFYINVGKKKTIASTLVKFEDGEPVVLRLGAVRIKTAKK